MTNYYTGNKLNKKLFSHFDNFEKNTKINSINQKINLKIANEKIRINYTFNLDTINKQNTLNKHALLILSD